MNKWDFDIFQEKLGNTVEFGIIMGNWFTGKSTLSTIMAESFGYTVIDMKAIEK